MELSHERALEFLRRNQPMAADSDLSRSDVEELDSVRRYLRENPHPEALDPLLGVFGNGSGFGVYQHIEDTVAAYDRSAVVPLLRKKIDAGCRSVRYWCTQIAMGYPDERLIDALARNLDPDDYDLRFVSIAALDRIGTESAQAVLASWLPYETDEELREILVEAVRR